MAWAAVYELDVYPGSGRRGSGAADGAAVEMEEVVMPMYRRRALYPEDWEAIAAAVKEAAGWRCEQCGHPHEPAAGYTLTVHHIDGNPGNNAPENLVALCQRCHLGLHGRRYWIGQGMFEFFKPRWLLQRERRARHTSEG